MKQKRNVMTSVEYIQKKLPQEELLAQLAEECAELSKAALKLRRVYDGKNPTPVKRSEAYKNLVEEVADVYLCIEVLNINTPNVLFEVQQTVKMKLARWCSRLGGNECPVCGNTISVKLSECPECRVYQHDPDALMGEYEEENE